MSDNLIKVTVLRSTIDERGGSFKNDRGEEVEFTTRKQKAKLEAGGFSYPFDVRLDKGQPPYAEGEYLLDIGQMAQVNKGTLTLSKFTLLTPLAKGAAAPKAA